MYINLGGKLIDLSSPIVMSIINATPDSFYENSRNKDEAMILKNVEKALSEGASIIDIGGYSSRPNAEEISYDEEWRRVNKALKAIRKEFGDIDISIDTFRSKVIKQLFDTHGAVIVNDITAGFGDIDMLKLVGELKLPYIAMHMRGTPQTMNSMTDYSDLLKEIIQYFTERVHAMKQNGIKDIILDVGFGFAKNRDQNFELLRRHDELRIFGKPLLGGISRKSMICKTLDIEPTEALNGTTALHWELLLNGANILRVHDTKEAIETIKLFKSCYPNHNKSNTLQL